MAFLFKPSKWLLLILGNSEYIRRDIDTNLTRAAQLIGKSPPPYEIESLDISKTREFPAGEPSVNEIEEEFNEKILNDLIVRKKKTGAMNVALIMERNAFPTDDIFEKVVRIVKHDDSIYHIICSKGSFIDTKKRKKCYITSCDKCMEPLCNHGCLLRLLWVIFKDTRALSVLDSEKT